jgi:hypothetical protein
MKSYHTCRSAMYFTSIILKVLSTRTVNGKLFPEMISLADAATFSARLGSLKLKFALSSCRFTRINGNCCRKLDNTSYAGDVVVISVEILGSKNLYCTKSHFLCVQIQLILALLPASFSPYPILSWRLQTQLSPNKVFQPFRYSYRTFSLFVVIVVQWS